MNDPKSSETELAFVRDHRKDLALSCLARANESGTVLRTLLFAASSGAIGFVLQREKDGSLGWHFLSLAFFFAAAVVVFWSWDLQKRKVVGRFNKLKENELEQYLKPDLQPNNALDRTAGLLIGAGIISEMVLASGCCGA